MDIVLFENKRMLKSSKLKNIEFIEHVFSTRDFGNQGLHVSDDINTVLNNRLNLAKSINIDFKKLVSAQQVHGTKVKRVYIEDIGKGSIRYEESLQNYDALITNVPELPLFAFYADCVPVFIVDPIKRCIAIVHSGWKGTLNNITENVINKMINEFNSDPTDLIAVIGPHINSSCYEVNDEIIKQFEIAGYDKDSQIKGRNLDLGLIIKNQLINKGLKNIEADNHCTGCDLNLFFSHRMENGQTGRMAGIIMIKGG